MTKPRAIRSSKDSKTRHRFFINKITDLRIRHPAIRADPDEPVGDSDLVQVALLAVDDESVRNPNLGHEGPVESELSHTC